MNCPVWPCARRKSRRATDRSEEAPDECALGPGDTYLASSNGLGEIQCAANMVAGNADSDTSRRDDTADG